MLARLGITVLSAVAMATLAGPATAGANQPVPGEVGPVPGGGAFVIQTCGETGSTAGWAITANSDPASLSAGMECPPARGNETTLPDSINQSGIWLSNRLGNAGGADAVAGAEAQLAFTAAPGTTISRVRYWRQLDKRSDNAWQPYVAQADGTVLETCEIVAGARTNCYVGDDDWYSYDPNPDFLRSAYTDLQGLSTTGLILGLRCRDQNTTHTCGGSYSDPQAQAQIFSAFLTLADTSAPSVGTPTGAGWTTTDWAEGTLPLSLTSSDNSGISATRVYADGSLIATLQSSCSYDRPRPCADESSGGVGLPTAGLPDGSHTIQLAAVDAAGNETRVSRPEPLRVDNQPPAAPIGLVSPAPSSQTNNFSASWSLPADNGSPITTAHYQLCEGTNCGAVQTSTSPTRLDGLQLPGTGTYTLRVWLVDQLGHTTPANAASTSLTYTPAAPNPQPGPQPAQSPPPLATTPTPTPKAEAKLKLTSLQRTGRRVTVAGTLTRAASGSVTVRYRIQVGRHTTTVTRHATISRGAFRVTFTLSSRVAPTRTARVIVTYSGDHHIAAQTRSAMMRVRR
jgi:hypothetical protein